ncbi:hypothetical protein EST38_g10310 [Candolleomyces aberdarensis]|uniref:DUF6533 domain-containing protein n=1 Tax=Candolleomyces aberdarensis TaxID=2316362 RepID=A0A4Q2D9X9_9AGAR|nr:hypothetical protein EST38_g10310 [Candolleomyces aberdarensis]
MDTINLDVAVGGKILSRHALITVTDWISTLPLETEVIWPSKWSLVKVLYILNRCFLADMVLYYVYLELEKVETCQMTFIVFGGIALSEATMAPLLAVIFIRLYALSGQSKVYGIWLPLQFIVVQVAGHCLEAFFAHRALAKKSYKQHQAEDVAVIDTSGFAVHFGICLPFFGAIHFATAIFGLLMANETSELPFSGDRKDLTDSRALHSRPLSNGASRA